LRRCSGIQGRAGSGEGGAKPSEAETLSAFGDAMEAANMSTF